MAEEKLSALRGLSLSPAGCGWDFQSLTFRVPPPPSQSFVMPSADWYYIQGGAAYIPMPNSAEPAIIDAKNVDMVGMHSTQWSVEPGGKYPMAWSRVWDRWIYMHHAVLGTYAVNPSPRQRTPPSE